MSVKSVIRIFPIPHTKFYAYRVPRNILKTDDWLVVSAVLDTYVEGFKDGYFLKKETPLIIETFRRLLPGVEINIPLAVLLKKTKKTCAKKSCTKIPKEGYKYCYGHRSYEFKDNRDELCHVHKNAICGYHFHLEDSKWVMVCNQIPEATIDFVPFCREHYNELMYTD